MIKTKCLLSMIAQQHVKENLQCSHLEQMTMEHFDVTAMVAPACARQLHRKQEHVPEHSMTDIVFTGIHKVSITSFGDITVSAF